MWKCALDFSLFIFFSAKFYIEKSHISPITSVNMCDLFLERPPSVWFVRNKKTSISETGGYSSTSHVKVYNLNFLVILYENTFIRSRS